MSRPAPKPDTERIPPWCFEAEQGALGCLLMAPKSTLELWFDKLPGSGKDYGGLYDPRHQVLFNEVTAMLDQGATVDMVTLAERLARLKIEEQVGGLGYVAGLPDKTPSAENAPHYLGILREKWLLRRTIAKASAVLAAAYASAGPVQVLGEAAVEFEELAGAAVNAEPRKLIPIVTAKELRDYKPDPRTFLVGANMIRRGELTVLAGWGGLGKSRLLTTLAVAGAKGRGDWMGYEVKRQFRTLVLQSQNSMDRLKSELSGLPEYINDNIRFSAPISLNFDRPDFRAELRRILQRWPCDVLGLDPWNVIAKDDDLPSCLAAIENIKDCLPEGDGPALVVVAHLRKPGRLDAWKPKRGRELAHEISGTHALVNEARTVFVLQPGSMDMQDDLVVFDCGKSNNDTPLAPGAYHRRNGEFVAEPNFDLDEWYNPPEDGKKMRKPTEDQIAVIFADGARRLSKKAVVEALMELGYSEASAYRYVRPGGPFAHRIHEADGLLCWV